MIQAATSGAVTSAVAEGGGTVLAADVDHVAGLTGQQHVQRLTGDVGRGEQGTGRLLAERLDPHRRRGAFGVDAVDPDAVRTEPSFFTLFGEYNKYLLRRVAVWADI